MFNLKILNIVHAAKLIYPRKYIQTIVLFKMLFYTVYNKQFLYKIFISNKWEMNDVKWDYFWRTIDFSLNRDIGVKGFYFFLFLYIN